MELHVDIYHSGQWHHAAVLQLLNPEQGRLSPSRLMYLQDYALDWMFRDDRFACSMNLPIEYGPGAFSRALAASQAQCKA